MKILRDLGLAEGRTAVVKDSGDFYEVYENGERILSVRKDFDVFEILADLGFDLVVCDDIDHPEEIETVKSLIRKVKSAEGAEKCGAIAIFVGFVRRISDGKEVLRLEYERYDELYWKKLNEIVDRIKSYEGIVDVRIYHKIGSIKPGEDILYVVVMGESRKSVYKPLEDCVEMIKRELPIWKKEVYEDGAVWVHDKSSPR